MDRRGFLESGMSGAVLLQGLAFRSAGSADSSNAIQSATPAGARLRDVMGVTVHFTVPVLTQLNAIRQAGMRWVRHDLAWARVEKTAGTFDFAEYDGHYQALLAYGLSPYAILDYTNPLYGGGAPLSRGSDEYQGFLRFVEAAVVRYQNLINAWEIWNEPNAPAMWRGTPDPASYAHLCQDVARLIRRHLPNATIVGGVTGHIDVPFLKSVAQAGGFSDVSIISVHPYRSTAPETATAEMESLKKDLSTLAGHALEIDPGEWGYSTALGISENVQAAYYCRMMLSSFSDRRRFAIWYDLVQDGADPKNREHNFGILSFGSLKPRAAFDGAVTLNRLLGDGTLVESATVGASLRTLTVDIHGMPGTAVWTSNDTTETCRLQVAGPAVLFDMLGRLQWFTPTAADHAVTLTAEGGPIYALGSRVTASL